MRGRTESLLVCLWVGGLWSLGYIATPVALTQLDLELAASLSAEWKRIMALLGIAIGTWLIVVRLAYDARTAIRSASFGVMVCMLLLSLTLALWVLPELVALRQLLATEPKLERTIADWHRWQEALYLLLSLCGLALVMLMSSAMIPKSETDGAQ